MYKTPEQLGDKHEMGRETSRVTGQKVRSAAEAAAQKELEDYMRQVIKARAAKRASANGEVSNSAAPSVPETISPAAAETVQKAKGNSAFKRALFGIILGGGIALGGFAGFRMNKQPAENKTMNIESTDQESEASPLEELVIPEIEKGIQDNYDKKGMWLSKTKPSEHAFASASEVAEVCDNDECEMIRYTAHNQVESLADYMANLPEQLQPEGFKGLSIIETEKKLESLSKQEYDKVLKQFDNTIENAFTRGVKLNGKYKNAFMRLKNQNSAVNHDNMELVECTTDEDGIEVTQFYWLDQDGNEIGSMTVKIIRNEDGTLKGCEQVVNKEGEKTHLYSGLVSISNPESHSDPSPNNPNPSPNNPDPSPNKPTPAPDDPTPTKPDHPTNENQPGGPTTEVTIPDIPDDPTFDSIIPDIPGESTPDKPAPEDPQPETDVKPKDSENLSRIDEQIQKDIAHDVGTENVQVTITPSEQVEQQPRTEKPSADAYKGTAPTIVENQASTEAAPVQEQVVTPENNYSQDRGGANQDEYAPTQENQAAQQAANEAETAIEDAPGVEDVGGVELDDILSDLGIE